MKPARTALASLALLAVSACGSAEPKPAATPAYPPSSGESARADGPVNGRSSPADRQPARPGGEPARVAGESARPIAVGGTPWIEPPPPYAPYGVEILGGDYRRLPTYYQGGRSYVMGMFGDRYRIRVTNPTSRRVEAV